MKALLPVCLLLAAAAWSQTAAPKPPAAPPPAPGTPAPKLPPDTVVASVQGKPITAGEVEEWVKGFPPQIRQSYNSNPREIVRQYIVFRYIAQIGEKKGLDKQSPAKEQLAFLRTQALWQAQMATVNQELNATPEDYEKYYNDHKDKYTQAKVKAIYIPYTNAPPPDPKAGATPDPKAKKLLTEAEAKARAEEVARLARGGSDFVELVKKYSEDPQSAQKGGDLPPISKSDALPEPLKTAIFNLQKDEISDPVKHTNGYYVFRSEGLTTQTFEQAREQINQEVKGERMRDWVAKTEKEADVKIENEAFFAQPVRPAQ